MLAGMLMPLGFEVAWIVCLMAGVGKELYDLLSGKGTPEVGDALATIAGGSLVVIITIIN